MSARFNSGNVGQILIKFVMDIMLLEGTQNPHILISLFGVTKMELANHLRISRVINAI